MPENVYTVDEVFGVSREVPKNYVARSEVDGKLIESLSREQHIVIYGSSKQGKTCLRKHCLQDNDYIVVSCLNRWGLGELHGTILKEAGYEVTQSSSRTVSGQNKIIVTGEGSGGIPIVAHGRVGASAEVSDGSTTTKTSAALELDPLDVNDIIRALEATGFRKYIVLEGGLPLSPG